MPPMGTQLARNHEYYLDILMICEPCLVKVLKKGLSYLLITKASMTMMFHPSLK